MKKTYGTLRSAVKEAMFTPAGKQLIDAIIREAKTDDTPIITDNVNLQYYRLGQQSIGQQIKKHMESDNEST